MFEKLHSWLSNKFRLSFLSILRELDQIISHFVDFCQKLENYRFLAWNCVLLLFICLMQSWLFRKMLKKLTHDFEIRKTIQIHDFRFTQRTTLYYVSKGTAHWCFFQISKRHQKTSLLTPFLKNSDKFRKLYLLALLGEIGGNIPKMALLLGVWENFFFEILT